MTTEKEKGVTISEKILYFYLTITNQIFEKKKNILYAYPSVDGEN